MQEAMWRVEMLEARQPLPRHHDSLSAAGGLEALPIWAVNQTDDGELPPCSSLGRIPPPSQLKHAHLGLTEERL